MPVTRKKYNKHVLANIVCRLFIEIFWEHRRKALQFLMCYCCERTLLIVGEQICTMHYLYIIEPQSKCTASTMVVP